MLGADAGEESLDSPIAPPGKLLQGALQHLRAAPADPEDPWRFIAFALPRAVESKAQLFQDLWALWTSGQKRGGYFVEIGAADGVALSNTWLLETGHGWTGVIAEPNPGYAEALKRRACDVSALCVSSQTGLTVPFLATAKPEFSRMASVDPGDAHEDKRLRDYREISVETVTLGDLLERHGAPGVIDYLSLDTEGSEFDILEHLDFDRWRIQAVTVEHNFTPARERLHDLLASRGYERQWPELSRWDDWYVRRR